MKILKSILARRKVCFVEIFKAIEQRIKEFEELGKRGFVTFNFKPFLDLTIDASIESELAFCISTANSSAKSGLLFQKKIEGVELEKLSEEKIASMLKDSGVRFYKRKAAYIKGAIENFDVVKKALKLESVKAREVLVANVKGLGYKEASHFLRNVGRKDVAIIDRHVLRWLQQNGYIDDSNITAKRYIEIEKVLSSIASKFSTSLAALDLQIWAEMTGAVLK